MKDKPSQLVTSYPPFFGIRRELRCPPLERYDFAAADGAGLCLHHAKGGNRGPVLVSPGTAMTALTYCIDSVPMNLTEYLLEQGFDVWLFDWRTSPILAAHEQPYTLDDVAKYDWPAAVEQVLKRTGAKQVSVMAHCLSSPCFLLSLVRGYMPKEPIKAFVASQVALDLKMTPVGRFKLGMHVEALLPRVEMMHQKSSHLGAGIADFAVGFVSRIIPKSYKCNNDACHRHSATFGDLILHSNVNPTTHTMMGDLIPECLAAFLKDVAIWGRKVSALTDEDRKHLDRLKIPIHFISGSENRMFVPESTELTYRTLCEANGQEFYRRTVYPNFGHLDCYIGEAAAKAIWPDIASTLAGDEAPATAVVASSAIGVTFREKMEGGCAMGTTDPETGASQGQAEGTTLTMHGEIVIDDIDRFIREPSHAGKLVGSIDFPPLGIGLPSTSGVFNLFIATDDPNTKYMVYEMGFVSGGENYYMAGHKNVVVGPATEGWEATTTLYTTLHEGTDKSGPMVGAGIIKLSALGLAEMCATFRAIDAPSELQGAEAIGRFGEFFMGELWKTYITHSTGVA